MYGQAEEIALRAKLTLDEVYARFRADMFLSSLAESGKRQDDLLDSLNTDVFHSNDDPDGHVRRYCALVGIARHVGDAHDRREALLGAHGLHRAARTCFVSEGSRSVPRAHPHLPYKPGAS